MPKIRFRSKSKLNGTAGRAKENPFAVPLSYLAAAKIG
jgi:hypothetical protein